MTVNPKPTPKRNVTLVRSAYQPSKAEDGKGYRRSEGGRLHADAGGTGAGRAASHQHQVEGSTVLAGGSRHYRIINPKNYLSQDWDTSDRIFLFISVNGDVHTPNIEQQVEIVPPTVDGTPSVSGAGTDAQWSVGETVGVTVTFSEAVDVDTSGGTPSIGIGLGGTAARSATYASGTGTTELVFEYTLVSGDGSHGYMAVTPDSLALNGGTIRSAGSGVDALLAHNGALTSGNPERSTGPEASFQDVPKSHDGATAFTVGGPVQRPARRALGHAGRGLGAGGDGGERDRRAGDVR